MSEISDTVKELRALHEHVTAFHAEMGARGFVMAGDTSMRLQQAQALITRVDGAEAAEWLAEANAVAALLRAEGGMVVKSNA